MKQNDILSRESVDEMFYRSKKSRDRLIFELQARCGMRIGEVLNLRVSDITDRKLIIRQPKSGKDFSIVSSFLYSSLASQQWLMNPRYFLEIVILRYSLVVIQYETDVTDL